MQLAGPREVALGRIGRDADDLGAERRVLRLVIPEPGEFEVSAAGERLDVEREHHELALFQGLGQTKGLAVLIGQRHVGGALAGGNRRRPLCR